MPITPYFVLSQTETTVTVDIRVPHVRVSVNSVEVLVDGSVLHFSSPPYLLILNFPSEFAQDENGTSECATYDPSRDGGTITLQLRKQDAAVWPDLDMMGSLMTPKPSVGSRPANVTVVSSTSDEREESNSIKEDDDEKGSSSNASSGLTNVRHALRPHYGFLNQHVAVFTDLAREGLASEMLELPFPDETDSTDRRQMRLDAEEEKFDVDRYVEDLSLEDDYIYQAAVSMLPHWISEQKRKENEVDSLAKAMSQLTTNRSQDGQAGLSSNCYFTSDETAQLASIPYPILPGNISSVQEKSLLLGLLDLLFAYVYDHILTQGDPTVESSWTICTLSCTLSWLEEYNGVNDTVRTVVTNSVRRALIYPYLRNYVLALHCWRQVACIIKNGRRCVIRSLLQLRSILDKSECHYLGNRLYIDPYLIWMQKNVPDKLLAMIEHEVSTVLKDIQGGMCLGKESVGLNLVEIERMAQQLEQNCLEQETDDSSQSSDSDSERTSEEASSTGDESDNHSSSEDAERVDQEATAEAKVVLPSSETTNTNQEPFAANSLESPSTRSKVKFHSKELLDSELQVSSQAENGSLGGICNPPVMAPTTDGCLVAKEPTETLKPLIEEI